MDDTYIKVPGIQRKLKQAQEEHAVLYIHALGGYGKTAAVAYFLRNRAYLYLSGAEGVLNEAPPLEQIKQTTIVIDDISMITSESSRDYIRKLLTTTMTVEKQLILIGRTAAPHWLGLEFMESVQIDKDGNATLDFVHASVYTIVVSAEPMSAADLVVNADADSTDTDSAEKDAAASAVEAQNQTSNNTWIWILVIAGAVIVLGGVLVFMKKKQEKNKEEN